MNSDRYARVCDLFHDALRDDPLVRIERLHRACANDLILLDEVGEMLAADARAELDGFLKCSDHASDSDSEGSGGAADSLLGQRLGGYEIRERLGQGGMGTVYKAWHDKLRRFAAIKMLKPELVENHDLIARFHREWELLGRLVHPNIVLAYDAGEAQGRHYLAMQFVEGDNLARRIKRDGPLPIPAACEFARQAACGLECARLAGLVHRDVKPSNLMVSQQGEVKLLDLGLASCRSSTLSNVRLTQTGQVMGTFDYISPEQIEHPESVDTRSDIYSLGCTLYHLLTGQPPFADSTSIQKLDLHRRELPPAPSKLRREVPVELDKLVLTMLAKSPSKRFKTPAEVARALQPFCTVPGKASRQDEASATPFSVGQREGARRGRGVRLGLLALLPLLVLGIILLIKTDRGTWTLKLPGLLPEQTQIAEDGDAITITDPAKLDDKLVLEPGEQGVEVNGTPAATNDVGESIIERDGKPVGTATFTADANPKRRPQPEGPGPPLDDVGEPESRPRTQWLFPEEKDISIPGQAGLSTSIAYSRDGLHAFSVCSDGRFREWDVLAGKQLSYVDHPASHPVFLAALPDPKNQVVLAAGGDRFVRAIRQRKAAWTIDTLPIDLESRAVAVAVSKSGTYAAAADAKGNIVVWNIARGKGVLNRFTQTNTINSLAFSPDDRRLICAGEDRAVRIWNLAEDRQEPGIEGLPASAVFARFTPDGKRIVLATREPKSTIAVYDAATLTKEAGWDAPRSAGAISAAALNGDGRLLITGHLNSDVMMWDLETGEAISSEKRHTKTVRAVAVSPEGTQALTTGDDGLVCVWGLPREVAEKSR